MFRNKFFYQSSTNVVKIGFSDHLALVMNIHVKRPATFSINIVKRVFSQRSIDIFNGQLKTELWEDVYLQYDVNTAYGSFLTVFLMYFPPKQVLNKKGKKSWITEGIKVSRQRLQLLRLLKRKMSPFASTLNFIKKISVHL
jgi:hypothetical protein